MVCMKGINMKKLFILLFGTISLVFLVSCDPRKPMSQEFQDELYNMAYIIVLNDDNWNSNFYYQENNVVIGDTFGEGYISDSNLDYDTYLAKKDEFANLITNILQEKENYTVAGTIAVGVADIIFIDINNDLKNQYFQNEDCIVNISFGFYENHSLVLSLYKEENNVIDDYEFYFFADKNNHLSSWYTSYTIEP